MAARNRKSNIYLAIFSVNVKVLESLSTTAELNVRLPVIFSYMTGLPSAIGKFGIGRGLVPENGSVD